MRCGKPTGRTGPWVKSRHRGGTASGLVPCARGSMRKQGHGGATRRANVTGSTQAATHMMILVPEVSLNNGLRMPQLGLGVWQGPDRVAVEAVVTALAAGYRSIDTAASYGNDVRVGEGQRRTAVAREEGCGT